MPIALRAVPRVLELLTVVLKNEGIISFSSWHEDSDLDSDIQGAIVQLDYPPDNISKGALPGLTWLENYLAHDSDWHRLPIILTAWNPQVFASGSQRMLNEMLGVQSMYGLLESPLLHFLPLSDLLYLDGLSKIRTHFKKAASIENDLLEDISRNCYQQADTASSCHRLRQLMSSTWQMYSVSSGEPIVGRFRRDLNDVRARVGELLPPSERDRLEADVEKILRSMSKCKEMLEFLRHFRRLETRLHIAEETQHAHDFAGLHGKLLLISQDYAFATEFEKTLGNWAVEVQVVDTGQSALTALKGSPLTYCCLLSDFRMHTPEGKLSTRQGYTELATVAEAYPHLPSAYVTGMYGARWSQPRDRRRLVFDKEELRSPNSPASQALYQFLTMAVEQLENQRLSLPRKLLGGKKIFATLLEHRSSVIPLLQNHRAELFQWGSDFLDERPSQQKFELTKQKYLDGIEFLRERLFLRLLILFLVRLQTEPDNYTKGQHYKDYLRRVLNYLWPAQDVDHVSDHHMETIQRECTDFLRIFCSKQYHRKSTQSLLREELIFPHEAYLLTDLEKQFAITYKS